jgi:hypothetical protein
MKACIAIGAVVGLLAFSGCQHSANPDGPVWQEVSEASMTAEQAAQRKKALAARDAMFTKLKGRLMEVAGSEGPAAAIEVCSKEAPQIASEISQEHAVSIGRTAIRLRNPKNDPPAWATKLVTDRVEKPTYLAQQGKLAALLPIRLQAPCLMCHGPDETLPPVVKDALGEHYPDDQATGFAEGELRGWFWIEIPASEGP